MRFFLLACAAFLVIASLGCAGGTQMLPEAQPDIQLHPVLNPLPSSDEDFGFSDTDDKAASAAYRYFFHDAVNEHSGGRWDVQNLSGKKTWVLSNVFYTDPKAWQMGGNYWNHEIDLLTSHPGLVQAGRKGIKLGYHGRWRIAPGDGCSVQYSIDGGPWTEMAFFSGGQNPSFPGWDRYTFALPDCQDFDQQYQVRFVFSSDGSMTDMGYGVDRLAIYQTLLTPPVNIEPSKEDPFELTIYMEHNFDGERPGVYEVYRSDTGEFGEYTPVTTTPYPGTMFNTTVVDESAAPFTEYWYKIKSTKQGWDDSDFSEADFGSYWLPEQ
jgi:hypothetical protein